MSQIIWITKPGSIGKIAESDYFEFQLDAYDTTGSPLTYKIISGQLSNGLQMFKSGLVQGIPILEMTAVPEEISQTFTVRATNNRGNISDRTFNVTVNSIALPQIIPKNVSLGEHFDSKLLDIQLVALDPNPTATLTWSVISGNLPSGVSLSEDGRLYGFLEPYYTQGSAANLGWNTADWDYLPWDQSANIVQSKTYRFKVQVFDGSRYDESTYTIFVRSKKTFTVDNTEILIDSSTYTIDTDNKYYPYLLTLPTEIPVIRQTSNFAFQFKGRDFEDYELQYEVILLGASLFDQGITDTNPYATTVRFDEEPFDQDPQYLPDNISLDPNTGWMTGAIGYQAEERKEYKFMVFCYRKDDINRRSLPVRFTLIVLGDVNNTVSWVTPDYVGQINNGAISEFSVKAVAAKGQMLTYKMKESISTPRFVDPSLTVIKYTPTARSRLPQGLKLLPDGLIVGRTTFDHFTLDKGATQIDKKTTNFDNVYQFTVTASDRTDEQPESVSADKTFTIRVNNFNDSPYENIYLRALPTKEQRVKFLDLLDDKSIFPDQLIYRLNDPWFSKATDIKCLFAAGLAPNFASTYVTTMYDHHYNKGVNLGNVKTAVALDENFNIRYEVVYVELIDPNNPTDLKSAWSIDRSDEVKSPYTSMPFTQVFPNTLNNMKDEVIQLGYANRGALPDWMLDKQNDERVLGFTRGIVLAYTVPGASSLIAFRLQQNNVTFNDLDFVVDRYQLDNYLSEFYDITAHEFVESKETTFDRLPSVSNVYAGAVDLALTVQFDEINGRPINYIIRGGGLDGSHSIYTGQLVVFARQELYAQSSITITKDSFDANNFDMLEFNLSSANPVSNTANDGWNVVGGLYGTFDYGVDPYAPSMPVPGYLEMLANDSVNQRGGIWKVVVTNSIVTLEFVKEVHINEYVQVGSGQSYGGSKLYYDPVIKYGHSVPEYSILTDKTNNSTNTTRFDGGATRFYNNRTMYAAPETNDVYLKFPKFNIYE